ncbi:MAG: aspartyl-tRNA(Asn)/glutamyl-tRNA(Gln) amidotransferase subunit [Sphingomonadales bacterium]|nr:aspartyl-tRNA(Asn)/glutamyl-tRNA(Gln) amidotransferase subunit [Sphingomonadales bacterium]
MTTLTDLGVAAIRDGVRDGAFSAREVAAAYIANVEKARGLNAFVVETPEHALAAAAAADAARASGTLKPLSGVPLGIKDLFATEGVQTTAGSRILEGYRPVYESTVSGNLFAAGAGMLGKLNMDEFAMGSSNETSAWGPVLSPWRRSDGGNVPLTPGGSSGGSASAVAARLAPGVTGTDTGGSIRQPASLCGIVGLKPTYGAISRYGMVAFASSLDQCGPLTRDVTDAALLLGAMQGRDPRDSTSTGIEAGVELPSRGDLAGLRIGVARDFSHHAEGVEPGVAEVFERSLRLVEELGGEVVEIELPSAEHGISAYYVLAPAEASANLARYDGVRYGLRVDGEADLIGMYERTRARGFGAEVKRRIMLGTYTLSSGYYEAYYGRAQKVRTLIARDFRRAFEACDLVITPTSPSVAFELGARTANPLAMYLSDYFTVPMSLAGIPAVSIPAGLAQPPGGGPELPVGVQLASPAFTETGLLDAAFALEQSIGFDGRPPA